MANDVVGQIALELNLDSKDFKKQLQNLGKSTEKSAQSITNSFGNAFSKITAGMAAAFSVSKVIQFGKTCIETAASVQAANSQFEQTFGEMQSTAESAIKSIADSSGIIETRLQSVGTNIYAFAKTTGMDSASAMSLMSDALQVTADSAAYYDRSLEETAESLKSFLKGNFENDAALGLSCTETTRNAAANKLYGKSFTELSEAQKQLTLLQMVKDANQLSGAMGQASREADGWENVTGNLKEVWSQLLAVIGQPVLQVAISVVKQITSAIQQLTVYAKSAISTLSELFNWGTENQTVSSTVSDTASSVSDLSSSTGTISDNMADTANSAEKIKKSLASFDQLNILSSDDSSNTSDTSTDSTSDSTLITTPALDTSETEKSIDDFITNIKKELESFYKNSGIEDFAVKIQNSIDSVDFTAIKNNFKSIMKSLQPIAKSTSKCLQKIFKSFMGTIGSIIGRTILVSGKALQTLSGGVAQWLERDKEKISGYIDTISNDISAGLDYLSAFVDNICATAGASIDRMRSQTESAIADMLSGTTTLLGSVVIILTGAFEGASQVINQWSIDNQELIGSFFDNILQIANDTMSLIGEIFLDTGNIMADWWNSGGGKEMWDSIVQVVMDLGTIFIEVFNEWIMPIWDAFITACESAWNDCLAPVFQKIMDVLTKLWNDIIYPLWQNVLKPFVDWIVNTLGPVFKSVFSTIGSICQTVFETIGGFVGGLLDALGGLIDFISGVFTGNWEKAWQGISDFFSGIWNGIWSVIKGIINLIIDGINLLWSGIYYAVKGIVDSIGGVSGALGSLFGQDWSFSMPSEPPLIPKLAKGGLVTAPTLALVGDNKNAQSDPEVVAPLSKLKGMITEEQQMGGNSEVLTMLRRIYDLLSNQETQYTNVIYLDSEEIERKLVKVRKRKSRRYGGAVT